MQQHIVNVRADVQNQFVQLRNLATNSISVYGVAGWRWTGGAMTNTITAGASMTFGFACDPISGYTNAYATAEGQ